MDIPVKPGDKIRGNLKFEHPVGHGAYGYVWKVWHTELDQPRAVKLIDITNLDQVNLKRVKNECRIGGKLGSDVGVVQVYDAFEEGDHLYIVMELMEGGSLDQAIKEKPHAFDVTLDWASEICEALNAVHAQDIIHRDIKPKNILLTGNGRVKLSDFGIAHLPRSEITSYQPGTPGYRAPELETNREVTTAADVFSLSAVLFELWSGRAYGPYKAQDIHRNLTPASIFLTVDGSIKVGNFDYARVPMLGFTISQTGKALVQTRYTAPEQLSDPRTADYRADLYSLGVIWYDMLFRPGSEEPMLVHQVDNAPISTDAKELLKSLLSHRAPDRPESAAEVVDWFELLKG